MAVRGLDLFAERFEAYQDAFILIGGAACDLWFTDLNMDFRATKDLDMVLIVEESTPEFIDQLNQFIMDGQYEIKNRNENGSPMLYRFEKPKKEAFPHMIELFSRQTDELILPQDQQIIPIRMEVAKSLSAILLNDIYYRFLLKHCRISQGIKAADGTALIPLKSRAWLDLTERKANKEPVKDNDIKKHRNDVFRLALTLPETPGDRLPRELEEDVKEFLSRFPLTNEQDWLAIQMGIRRTAGGRIRPENLTKAINNYFQLM